LNKSIISTGSKEATQAGVEILKAGGNAFDAAVAAVFTSMTSEFALTGAGGGGAMMIRKPDFDPVLYDFFVDTPPRTGKKELDFFGVEVDFGDSTQTFHIGKGSAAVPGTLLGLVIVQEQFGVLPLPVVMEPAIKLAQEGYVLNKKQAYIFKILEPIFTHTKTGRDLFCSNGKMLSEGHRFVNSDFAEFLKRVSWEGATSFYLGEYAELIAQTFGKEGLLNEKSMSLYHVSVRKPVMTKFMGTQVYSNPAPSAGGTLIIFLLRLLEEGKLKDLNMGHIIQAMAVTNSARKEVCINPNKEYQIEQLLEDEIFNGNLEKFLSKCTESDNNFTISGRGETTHVSVIDKDMNCASVTTTNGEGCGYILPGTGIMLNNMLGEEDLNPLGFHQWRHPMRLPTMVSPTIIMKDNQPFIILGSGGSNRIRSAIVQVILNYMVKGIGLDEAIISSRIHLEGKTLYYEPGLDFLTADLPEDITLHPFEEKNLFFGGVNAVTLTEGASDIRRGGTFEIVD
jgi:gamma-glutamyltranspeptidase/glutathione hydrolase